MSVVYYLQVPIAIWIASAIASHAWHTVKMGLIRRFEIKVKQRSGDSHDAP